MPHDSNYLLQHEVVEEIRGVYCEMAGEVSYVTAPKVEADLVRRIDLHGGSTVVDIRDVRYLDSSGIKMFCRLCVGAKKRGAAMVLITNRFQDRVLKVLGLGGALPTAKSRDESIRLLRKPALA